MHYATRAANVGDTVVLNLRIARPCQVLSPLRLLSCRIAESTALL